MITVIQEFATMVSSVAPHRITRSDAWAAAARIAAAPTWSYDRVGREDEAVRAAIILEWMWGVLGDDAVVAAVPASALAAWNNMLAIKTATAATDADLAAHAATALTADWGEAAAASNASTAAINASSAASSYEAASASASAATAAAVAVSATKAAQVAARAVRAVKWAAITSEAGWRNNVPGTRMDSQIWFEHHPASVVAAISDDTVKSDA